MPPESQPSSSRRSSRRFTPNDNTELKRARGEISCAECKRSKVKCDKKVPCGSCVRRGCASVCPNGSFTTSQGLGYRLILADTEDLHRKIYEMGQRIRLLEDALAVLQSSVSSQPHPLLEDSLLSVKYGLEHETGIESTSDAFSESETIESFGTLTIGDSGEARYFGPSAGSETLLLAGAKLVPENFREDSKPKMVPGIISSLASMSYMGNACTTGSETWKNAMSLLFEFLPPRSRAWSLCEVFLENSFSQLITREELIQDVLTPIYKAKEERDDPAREAQTEISPHKFSIMYLVFAQGSLMDLTLPLINDDGEYYHHFARAALALRSIIDSPRTETIQAILIMAHYRSGAGELYTRDNVWTLLALACKLAQITGLHRDPKRWDMDERTASCRRRIFWEAFSGDMALSLILGRPPVMELSYVDCGFPGAPDLEAKFWNWKYKFIRDLFGSIMKITQAAAPPSYKTILELDKRVREMSSLPELSDALTKDDAHMNPGMYMKAVMITHLRSIPMILIHRSFFAQALLDHPDNPLRSPYAPSFLAAYRAASAMIKDSITHYQKLPDIMMRWRTMWPLLFSAAIIVGLIVTKAPSSGMASTAFIELSLAVDLFAKTADTSKRNRTAMAILTKLKEKAFLVFSQTRSDISSISPNFQKIFLDQADGLDELSIFGGQTPILVINTLSQKSSEVEKDQKSPPVNLPPHGALNSVSTASDAQSISKGVNVGMTDAVTSLTHQYIPSTNFATPADVHEQPGSLNQLNQLSSDWLPELSSLTSTTQASNTFHLQDSSRPSQAPSEGMLDSFTSFNSFQQHYQDTFPDTTALDTWRSNDFTDFGLMMNDYNGMDEEWTAFMKEGGMINSDTFNTTQVDMYQ